MKYLLIFISIWGFSKATVEADTVTCPKLSCSENLGNGVCYMHSSSNPVEWIKFSSCGDQQWCDLYTDYAYFDMFKQTILGSTDHSKSVTFKKLTESKCEAISKFR